MPARQEPAFGFLYLFQDCDARTNQKNYKFYQFSGEIDNALSHLTPFQVQNEGVQINAHLFRVGGEVETHNQDIAG